jgi:hypothetical protein
MKKLSILATLVVLLVVAVVPAMAITGGELDDDRHPNAGAIVVDYVYGPFVMCSGTLIAGDVFLTAGHCTDGLLYYIEMGYFGAEDVYVSFDDDDVLTQGWRPLAPDGIVSHPDYWWGPRSNPYDVGALILADYIPEDEIAYANLPAENYLDDLDDAGLLKQGKERAVFTVVGYGAILEWPPPEIIYEDGPRRVAWSEFLNLRKAWLNMSQNQAPGRGDSGSCYGDSGGPIFWTEEDGTEILVAVTSWGDAVCVATGVAYRVDIPSSLAFIESLMD